MRFDFDAYEKVFPTAPQAPEQDTAVPAETPKATDDKPGDDKATPEPEQANNEPIVTVEDMPGDTGEGA